MCHQKGQEEGTEQQDPYEISPWMVNPFNPPQKIYWLICPTHQVCSIQFDTFTLAHVLL